MDGEARQADELGRDAAFIANRSAALQARA